MAGERRVANEIFRAPAASRGFVPLAQWHQGRGIRGETKSVDYAATTSTIALNAAIATTGLNFVQAGSSFFNRIGRKIAMQSLYFNGFITGVSDGANYTQEYLRVIIVYDAQTNGALPIWSDIVQSTTQNAASSSLTLDGFNLNNRDRFKILLDKRFAMPSQNVVSAAANLPSVPVPTMCEMMIQEFRKLNNLETQYKADSSPAVIGDVATGGVFIAFQGTVGGQWNINWTTRIRYTDN